MELRLREKSIERKRKEEADREKQEKEDQEDRVRENERYIQVDVEIDGCIQHVPVPTSVQVSTQHSNTRFTPFLNTIL